MSRYRLNGKREKVVIGRYPDVTLKAARDERAKMAAEVARGESPAAERKLARAGLKTNPTVKEFGERYYTEQVLSRWKDPKTIRRYLDNEIFPYLGDKALKDVNALDVQALVYRKRDNGRVQAAMQLRNVIKQIFDYAIETHRADQSRCNGGNAIHRQGSPAVPRSFSERDSPLPPHGLPVEHAAPIQSWPCTSSC